MTLITFLKIRTCSYYFKHHLTALKYFKQHVSKRSMNSKPPNILVYTGRNCPKLFTKVEKSIISCLQSDTYIVYHLLASEINKHPWMENSLLLVISSDVIENDILQSFELYLKDFGNALIICSKFDNFLNGNKCRQTSDKEKLIKIHFKDAEMSIFRGKYSYDCSGTVLCSDNSKTPLIQKVTHNENILIFSDIYLDRDPNDCDISSDYNSGDRLSILKYVLTKEFGLEANVDNYLPELSPGYYINDDESQIVKVMNQINLDDISSEMPIFFECKFKNLDRLIKLPIYFYHNNLLELVTFDKNIYFSRLRTNIYGHHVVYFPVITSTMEAAEQLSKYEGIVIVAGCQTSGKARGSNKWISPKGCAMFTLHFTIPLDSYLGKKMTLLQHIASLAVVHGIKSQEVYKDLKLNIKWPNDIYHNSTKLGGLLVASVIQKDLAHVNIGWGINIENSRPTLCLNDIIDKYNSENFASLPHLHTEEVIAFTVSQMEYFIKDFNEFGSEKFFAHYYLHWMHNNQEVTLTNMNEQGIVMGLDEYGFLKIKTNNNKILILQPDGNRFDIMRNLIHIV